MSEWLCETVAFVLREGLLLSICMWGIYYVWSRLWEPDVIFANKILRDGDTYFVRYMNIGLNDLIDCRRFVKLSTGTHRQHSAYIRIGDAEIHDCRFGVVNRRDSGLKWYQRYLKGKRTREKLIKLLSE